MDSRKGGHPTGRKTYKAEQIEHLTREDLGVILVHEPLDNPEAPLCFWWRPRRVELGVKQRFVMQLVPIQSGVTFVSSPGQPTLAVIMASGA